MTLVAITGASRGIGRATALYLAKRGVALALIGRESSEHRETERQLSELGATFTSFFADLSEATQVTRVGQELLTSVGAPDAAIFNAAVIERSLIVDTTDASFDLQLNVNLKAPFMLTRSWLRAMLEQRRGRLVFVGSISSTLGTREAASYCASKWGVVGFVKSLAEELANTGLMAVAVLPGSVDTRMLAGSGFEPRIQADEVAATLGHYALDAPLAHNGGIIEMFGV